MAISRRFTRVGIEVVEDDIFMFSLDNLTSILQPEQIDSFRFSGKSLIGTLPRVFGGQVLGQALQAATVTVGNDRHAHSVHAHFLRIGDIHQDIIYQVGVVRDGGSFSTRSVVAEQAGKAIFHATLSFHITEPGLSHQMGMPEDIPGPNMLENEADRRNRLGMPTPRFPMMALLPKETLDVRQRFPLEGVDVAHREPFQGFWFKFGEAFFRNPQNQAISDNIVTHQALLAFVSDMGLLSTGIRPHTETVSRDKIQAASLDHSIWMHAPVRVDQWLYYHTDSPLAGGGRDFCRGSIFTESGVLVASTAQEALIRIRNDV